MKFLPFLLLPVLGFSQSDSTGFYDVIGRFNTCVTVSNTDTIVSKEAYDLTIKNGVVLIKSESDTIINVHAELFAKDSNSRIYMVNPNTFISVSGEDSSLIYKNFQDNFSYIFLFLLPK